LASVTMSDCPSVVTVAPAPAGLDRQRGPGAALFLVNIAAFRAAAASASRPDAVQYRNESGSGDDDGGARCDRAAVARGRQHAAASGSRHRPRRAFSSFCR
jgi:hypothetical protein